MTHVCCIKLIVERGLSVHFLVFNLILTGLTPNHGKNSPLYYLKIK